MVRHPRISYEAQRMPAVQSPIIPMVGQLIRAHSGTIALGQGVVHYGPPPQAIERIKQFLADPENHKYSAVEGTPKLLAAIGAKLREENGICLDSDRCAVVTAGANMGFMYALYAITDPGDEVIIQLPHYFNHEMAIMMANCQPVPVATDENYQLDADAIAAAITGRTRAVVTISPNNPTRAVYDESVLRQVNDLCRRRGIYHIRDEAYEYFTYDGARHFSSGSIASKDDHTISLFSLSKAYGFASWRIGYMVILQRLLYSIKKAQDTIVICPPVISQEAAVGALATGLPYCREKLVDIAQTRELVLNELDRIRQFCTVPRTQGAFYFLLCLDTKIDPMDLVERLVCEHGVAVIPGTTFGMNEGCYLRVSYGAIKQQSVTEGMGRLVKGLTTLVG